MTPKHSGRVLFYCAILLIAIVGWGSYALTINGHSSGVAIWFGFLVGTFTGLLTSELVK